jgi:phage tail sheath protein FI
VTAWKAPAITRGVRDGLETVLADWMAACTDSTRPGAADLRHAQLQLVWPWLRSEGSDDCPQGLEAPEGAFAGALAAGALHSGTFRSLALQRAPRVRDTVPRLLADDAHRPLSGLGGDSLADRLTLVALDLDGWRWASDRTACVDPRLAIAPLRRLIAQLTRWLRSVGNDFVYEPSNEATWFRIRVALQAVGRQLYAAGALDGTSAEGAFVVVCDRRTMSQSDIDNGRLIIEVSLQPALPVERVKVLLTLVGGVAVASEFKEAA